MTTADFDACHTTSQMAQVTARHFESLRNPLLRHGILIQCTRPSMREAIRRSDPKLLVYADTGQPLIAVMVGAAWALAIFEGASERPAA